VPHRNNRVGVQSDEHERAVKAVIDRRYALADVREACLIENAVSASGARGILGLDLHTSENGAG
jgi:hypothetical protein